MPMPNQAPTMPTRSPTPAMPMKTQASGSQRNAPALMPYGVPRGGFLQPTQLAVPQAKDVSKSPGLGSDPVTMQNEPDGKNSKKDHGKLSLFRRNPSKKNVHAKDELNQDVTNSLGLGSNPITMQSGLKEDDAKRDQAKLNLFRRDMSQNTAPATVELKRSVPESVGLKPDSAALSISPHEAINAGKDHNKPGLFRRDRSKKGTLARDTLKEDVAVKDLPKNAFPKIDVAETGRSNKDASKDDLLNKHVSQHHVLGKTMPKVDLLNKDEHKHDMFKSNIFKKDGISKDLPKMDLHNRGPIDRTYLEKNGPSKDAPKGDLPSKDVHRDSLIKPNTIKKEEPSKYLSKVDLPKKDPIDRNQLKEDTKKNVQKDHSNRNLPKCLIPGKVPTRDEPDKKEGVDPKQMFQIIRRTYQRALCRHRTLLSTSRIRKAWTLRRSCRIARKTYRRALCQGKTGPTMT
jgi:hypothetical protein